MRNILLTLTGVLLSLAAFAEPEQSLLVLKEDRIKSFTVSFESVDCKGVYGMQGDTSLIEGGYLCKDGGNCAYYPEFDVVLNINGTEYLKSGYEAFGASRQFTGVITTKQCKSESLNRFNEVSSYFLNELDDVNTSRLFIEFKATGTVAKPTVQKLCYKKELALTVDTKANQIGHIENRKKYIKCP